MDSIAREVLGTRRELYVPCKCVIKVLLGSFQILAAVIEGHCDFIFEGSNLGLEGGPYFWDVFCVCFNSDCGDVAWDLISQHIIASGIVSSSAGSESGDGMPMGGR